MSIKAIRVSKTSFKDWYLSGPIDQALRTSTQAKNLRVFPLHLDDVHGEPVNCELWLDAKDWSHGDESNPRADHIIHQNALANAQTVKAMQEVETLPPCRGVAILTGPGGTDFPKAANGLSGCVLAALMGAHKPNSDSHADAPPEADPQA